MHTCVEILISNLCRFVALPVTFHRKQVTQVVQKTESLKRISFLAHSLGGLFARYAVAVLYSPNTPSSSKSNDLANPTIPQAAYSSKRGTIAGLEPINFITLATPHLGVRGRKQVCTDGYYVSALFCNDYTC